MPVYEVHRTINFNEYSTVTLITARTVKRVDYDAYIIVADGVIIEFAEPVESIEVQRDAKAV